MQSDSTVINRKDLAMSMETSEWLNTMTLIGYTAERGTAWHYREESQGEESNHYEGAVPVKDVERRLFYWDAVPGEVNATYVDMEGVEHSTPLPDRQAIIRSDTGACMGLHSESYQIHQFRDWLLDNVGTILDDDVQIGSAGLLRGGARAWVQIEMPENIKGPAGIEFRPHLLASTSHDGSLATTYQRSCTLVVCDNTLAMALGESTQQRMRVKHTKNSALKIHDARDALGIIYSTADTFSQELERLTATKVSDDQWAKIVEQLAPIPEEDGRARTMAENKSAALANLWREDPRVAPWRGTLFGVLQAANTYRHHIMIVRGAGEDADAVRILRGQRNMEAALSGKGAISDLEALKTAEAVLA